jgi:hypothetical protein
LHGCNGSPRYNSQLPKAEPCHGGVAKLHG